ncbi:hypothetical protein CPR19088_GLDEOEPO_02188 [Companilactobacillus paralimentarius]
MVEYIAVIIEGGAEKAIIRVLLDKDLLKFQRSNMLEEDVIQDRSGKSFAHEHLSYGFEDNQISILRIHDSRREKFILPRAYTRMISKITDIYTTPEIEILFIINNADFDKFKNRKPNKNGKKMSAHEWCRYYYKMDNVKSPKFVYDFWINQSERLVEVIKIYSSKSKDPFENTLASILSND